MQRAWKLALSAIVFSIVLMGGCDVLDNVFDDCPDTSASTCSVTVGSSASGVINDTGDRDAFKVTLEADTEYRIQLTGPEGSDFDFLIYHARGGSRTAYAVARGNEDVTYPTASVSGEHIIIVYRGSRSVTGRYTLRVSLL